MTASEPAPEPRPAVDGGHDPWGGAPPPAPAEPGRIVLVEGPKFVLERWSAGRAVALPDGVTGWLVPIAGEGEVAGVAFGAGECVMVTGAERVAAGEGADLLFAYPETRRM